MPTLTPDKPVFAAEAVRGEGDGGGDDDDGSDSVAYEDEVLEYCTQILAALARTSSDARGRMLTEAVPALVHLCDRGLYMAGAYDKVLGNATGVIGYLALDAHTRKQLLPMGAVPPLASLLAKAQDATLLGNVAGALSYLAVEREFREDMVRAGVPQSLVALCGRGGVVDHDVLGNAAQCVAVMSADFAIRTLLVREGIVQPLVQACTRSRPLPSGPLANVAKALAKLAQHRVCCCCCGKWCERSATSLVMRAAAVVCRWCMKEQWSL